MGLLDDYGLTQDQLELMRLQLPARDGGNTVPGAGPQMRAGHAQLAEPWAQRIPQGLLAGVEALAPGDTQQQLANFNGWSIPRGAQLDPVQTEDDPIGQRYYRTAQGERLPASPAGNLESLATLFPTGGGGLLGAEAGALGAGPIRRAASARPTRQQRALAPPMTAAQADASAEANGFAQVSRDADARLAAMTPEQRAAKEAEVAEMNRQMREQLPPPLPSLGGRGGPVSPVEIQGNLDLATAGKGRQVTIGDSVIDYDVRPGGKEAYVARLATFDDARGQGSARTAMQRFLGETDQRGLRTTLIPEPEEAGVDPKRLERFYRSLGYRAGGQGDMVRVPRTPAAAGLLNEAPPAAPAIAGNVDYGAEVLRQRSNQLDIPKQANRLQPNPADPAFDATPTAELLPGVAQGQMRPMRRAEPGEQLPNGGRAQPLVDMRDRIADRMASDLTPQLGHPTQFFYHMRPVYDALRKDGMSHDDALAFIQKDFAPTNAGTSPRTNTQQNLLNTSYLQYRRAQGLPNDEAALRGGQRGYGMIYNTHPRMVQGLLDGSHDVGANPKPYYFGGNIAGDLAYTTADTHAIRAATGTANALEPGVLPDAMLRPEARAGYAADPTRLDWATGIDDSLVRKTSKGEGWQPEYPVMHDIYEGVGQRLGIPTADAQSLAWFNYGGQTGLESAPRSIPQLLNERLSITAQALGISPQKALSLYRRGAIPLMGGAGAATLPGLLEEPAQ